MKTNYTNYFLLITVFLSTLSAQGQCDHLPWNPRLNMNNWKAEFSDLEWVPHEPNRKFIQADSVLAGYMSSEENSKHNGIGCSYVLAINYAEKEMESLVQILTDSLESEDSKQFVISQNHWNKYFKSEYELLKNTYFAYANVQKYGLGREQNLYSHIYCYDTIRWRILRLRSYIDELHFD